PEQYEQEMARESLLQRAANLTFVRVKEWEFYSNRDSAIAEVVQTCKDLGIRSLHDPLEVDGQEPEPHGHLGAGPTAEAVSQPLEEPEEAEEAAQAPNP